MSFGTRSIEPEPGRAGLESGDMTADGSQEPGRPKRRRRRRRPKAGGAAAAPASPDAGAGTGSQGHTHGGGAKRGKGKGAKGKGKRKRRGSGQGNAAHGKGQAQPSGGAARPKANIPTKKEVSAGGVVYRLDEDGTIEVLLASRRTRRGDLAWGLAKGGIEEGETTEDAAIREVREETGIRADIEESLGDTKYFYVWEDVRIRKTVHFFLMRATGGNPDDRDDEMEEIRWFPLDRALKRAAYRGERDVLGRAAELLR